MCVTNLSKVTLDSAAAGIEPATSSRKSNALTTTPPSHINYVFVVVDSFVNYYHCNIWSCDVALQDFQQELIRRLEVAGRLQDSVESDTCLTDDDRIRLSNLEAAVSRVQRLADSRLTKLHSALKLVHSIDECDVSRKLVSK